MNTADHFYLLLKPLFPENANLKIIDLKTDELVFRIDWRAPKGSGTKQLESIPMVAVAISTRTFVCLADYFVNPAFRRELLRVLNRGEATNALKRLIYTGRVANYQAKSEDEMQGKSGTGEAEKCALRRATETGLESLSCTGLLKKHREIGGISTVSYCTENEGTPRPARSRR